MKVQNSPCEDPLKPQDYNTVVITHGGCLDGTACTTMFLKYSKVQHQIKIYFHFAYERDFAKDTRMPCISGKKVFIVDYSYPVEVLHKIATKATEIYLWDHYETAMKSLFIPVDNTELSTSISVKSDIYFSTVNDEGRLKKVIFTDPNHDYVAGCKYLLNYGTGSDIAIPINNFIIRDYVIRDYVIRDYINNDYVCVSCKINIVFDTSKCATEIVFAQLWSMMEHKLETMGQFSAPWRLQHIRDRDLYLWDKPNAIEGVTYHKDSRAFAAAVYEMRITPENLLLLEQYSDKQIEEFYERGITIMVFEDRFTRNLCAKSEPVIFEEYHALFLNATRYTSRMLEICL